MTVALLVGTIRSLAHYTQSPGEILSAMNDFLKRYGMHLAGRPKGLHFNMAVCEEFEFVVSAWASESHHDGVTVALKVELNSTIPQPLDKLEKRF